MLYDEFAEPYERGFISDLADAGVDPELLFRSGTKYAPTHHLFLMQEPSGVLASCVYLAGLYLTGRNESLAPATLKSRRNLPQVLRLMDLMISLLPDNQDARVVVAERFWPIIRDRVMISYAPNGWKIPKDVQALMDAAPDDISGLDEW
ncbi:MAG TPA: hypothetical protein VGG75_06275 [Trebonia sp.]